MLHARKDYNRIQDLAEVVKFLTTLSNEYDSIGDKAASSIVEEVIVSILRKYNFYRNVEPIPQDEPVFLLRAKDMVAPSVVKFWAVNARSAGADETIVMAALEQAIAMRIWQKEHGCKVPDMPEGEKA